MRHSRVVTGIVVGAVALVMVAVSVLMMVVAWTGLRIGRREGGLFVTGDLAHLLALWPS